jgi:cysteine synthase
MNCVGAVKAARQLLRARGPGSHAHPPVIVTLLCDGGARHLSKFHNPSYLAERGLLPSAEALGERSHELQWVGE